MPTKIVQKMEKWEEGIGVVAVIWASFCLLEHYTEQ